MLCQYWPSRNTRVGRPPSALCQYRRYGSANSSAAQNEPSRRRIAGSCTWRLLCRGPGSTVRYVSTGHRVACA
eukprot:2530047-Rhodomonas_salina.3